MANEVRVYLVGDSNLARIHGEIAAAFPNARVAYFGRGGVRSDVPGSPPPRWQDPRDGTAVAVASTLRREREEAQKRGVALVQLVTVCIGWSGFDALWVWNHANNAYQIPGAGDINGLADVVQQATGTIASACTHCFPVYVANPECARISEQTGPPWPLPQYQAKLGGFRTALAARGTTVFVPKNPDVVGGTPPDTHLGPNSQREFVGVVVAGLRP